MLETRREKIVVLGGVPVIAVLFYMLLSGGEAEEQTRPALPPASRSAAVAPSAPPPAPVQAAPAPAQPPAPAAAGPAGVSLTGVLGTGRGGSAIVSYEGGAQRLVPVGRDVVPGLTLREVRRDRIVMSGPAGPVELAFGGTVTASAGAAPAGGAEAAARAYVGATEPRRVGGRVVGYRLRSASDIPLLQRAGLQPGDVLHPVNAYANDWLERLRSFPAVFGGAAAVEVEFERGGRKMRTRVATQ